MRCWALTGRRPGRTSKRPTGPWPRNVTPTCTPMTRPARPASRRSMRPMKSSLIRRSAPVMTSLAWMGHPWAALAALTHPALAGLSPSLTSSLAAAWGRPSAAAAPAPGMTCASICASALRRRPLAPRNPLISCATRNAKPVTAPAPRKAATPPPVPPVRGQARCARAGALW